MQKGETSCNGNNGSEGLLIVSELVDMDFKQLEIQKNN
jgi:hypothetical protein